MVWTCEKRGKGGGIEEGGENAGDRKQTTGKTIGNVGTVSTERHKNELKEEQAMDQKSWKKVEQMSTNSREGKGLQAKMMIMKLTFMSTWVCM